MERRSGTIYLADEERDEANSAVWGILHLMPYTVSIFAVPDYRFIYINQLQAKALQRFGLEHPEDILGKHPKDVFPHWTEVFLPICEQARTRREVLSIQDLACDIAGYAAHCDLVVVPHVTDPTGEVDYIALVSADVTERKRAEDELRAREARLAAAQALARVGSYEFELPNGEVIWSEETYRIIEMDPALEPPSVEQYMKLVHPDDRDRVWSEVNSSIESGAGLDIEYRVVLPVGTIKHIHSVGRPLLDDHGDARRFGGTIQDVTDLRRTEDALRETEERYRQIVETAREGVWLVSPDAETMYVNQRMADMLGYTPDEMLGRPLFDFMDDVAREEAGPIWEQRKAGISAQFDFRFRRKDGSDLWALVVANATMDEEGRLKSGFAMVTDISERKQAEEKLRKSQEMLQLVMDNIPQSIFWKDTNSVLLGCNQTFARQAGLANPEDIVGKTDYDLPWSMAESDAYRRDDRRVMASNVPALHIIEPQLQADGRQAWLDTNKVPIHDSDGNVVGVLGMYEDITERVRAEEDLLRFRSALDAATEGIGLTDPDGRIFYTNPAVSRMLGYTLEELQEKGLGITHADPSVLYDELLPSVTSGRPWTGEAQMLRKDGSSLIVDLRAAPVFDSNGVLVALMAILTDITERRRAEELSSDLNAMNAAIGSTLDMGDIMSRLVVESARAIGCESAIIFLREEGRWAPRYVHGALSELLGSTFSEEDMPFVTQAARTQEPVIINDVLGGQIVPSWTLIAAGVRSLLVLPLITKGESIGGLAFVYRSQPSAFSEAEVDFARKLGTSISLALENARLYEVERSAAIREAESRSIAEHQLGLLQRALLPGKPRLSPGYEVSAVYVPAYAGQEIGGDFYDVFETEDGSAGIMIGDVSGKGIGAAARAAASRSTVRAFAYELCVPGPALTHANSVLYAQQVAQEGVPESFVTLFLAILDPQSGRLKYAIAGHPPPVIYRASGGTELLRYGEPPVGALDSTLYSGSETVMGPGDRIVMYTDGLSEARRGGELFDIEKVEREVQRCGHGSAADIVDHLMSTVDEWTGHQVMDDTAILVVGRNPTS